MKNENSFEESEKFQLEDTPLARYDVYFTKPDRFEELFLVKDTNQVKEYILFFNHNAYKQDDKVAENLFKLRKHAKQLKIVLDWPALGRAHNSEGWQHLIAGNFAAAEQSIRKGIELYSENMMLYSNLPTALLLQGKTEEAKKHIKLYGKRELKIEDRLIDTLELLKDPAKRREWYNFFTTKKAATWGYSQSSCFFYGRLVGLKDVRLRWFRFWVGG